MGYEEALKSARKEILRLTIEQEKEIISIYEQAGADIAKKLARAKQGSLTERYLKSMYETLQQDLYIKLNELSVYSLETASQIATGIQAAFIDDISANINISNSFKAMFNTISKNVVNQLVSGKYYLDKIQLDKRIWAITESNIKNIDMLIKSNILGGANARDLAKQLEAYINPKKILSSVPIHVKGPDGKLKKLPPPSGISNKIAYQAQRLARTSLSQSFTETYIQSSKGNPFCVGLKWNLSPSHQDRQVKRWGEDICDQYARANGFGIGIGVYPSNNYPVQHPNCLCYPTMVTKSTEQARKELKEWVNGKVNKKLDDWMNKGG